MKDIYMIAAFLALIISYRAVSDTPSTKRHDQPAAFKSEETGITSLSLRIENLELQLKKLEKEQRFKGSFDNGLAKKAGK